MNQDAETILLTDLVEIFRGRLQDWCSGRGAKEEFASDAWSALMALAASPQGLIAVAYWGGDEDNGQRVNICANSLRIVLSRNQGLGADPAGNLVGTATKEPLFALVDSLRRHMLGLRFPEPSTSGRIEYLGASAFALPDGAPLDAYELRFEITATIDAGENLID